MRREAGSPKILIIPELRVLVLTKRHVGSGNEIAFHDDKTNLQSSLKKTTGATIGYNVKPGSHLRHNDITERSRKPKNTSLLNVLCL